MGGIWKEESREERRKKEGREERNMEIDGNTG